MCHQTDLRFAYLSVRDVCHPGDCFVWGNNAPALSRDSEFRAVSGCCLVAMETLVCTRTLLIHTKQSSVLLSSGWRAESHNQPTNDGALELGPNNN